MALVKDGPQYDIRASKLTPEVVGEAICVQLATKGFCVVDSGIDAETLRKAHKDVSEMDSMGKFKTPATLISEGLFGQEGSSRIAEMDEPGDLSTDGEHLQNLDAELNAMVNEVAGFAYEIVGVDCESRTLGLVHETDTAINDAEALVEKEASMWLNTFVRSKITAVLCLGPTKGTLELRPFNDDEAEAIEIETTPGALIILRSDSIWHRHFAHGKVYLLSCFLVEPRHLDKRASLEASQRMTPVAKALDNWCLQRVRELKNLQNVGEELLNVPSDFVRAMNQVCFKGQRAAIRTTAGKLPTMYELPKFDTAMTGGTDFSEQVPFTRWDHSEFYDPDPDGWRKGKTWVKHFSMIDGIDLFDNKLFGLSPAECAAMDPHQSAVLECGYEALWQCGYRKKTIMNTLGGVYMGTASTEWAYCPKSVQSAACATGGAASITANRFSFCLGLKGPSLALDAEGAAGLVAVHCGAEGVLEKGRGVVNAYSLSGGVHYHLYPTWWGQLQAAGLLCADGRSKTFDDSADGYGKGEGAMIMLIKRLTEAVDGQPVMVQNEPLLGVLAASYMNNNGMNASMGAPSATAEQEMIVMALRNSSITAGDIEAIECHGDGSFLGDAIEAGAFVRALRYDEDATPEPIIATACKTNLGHTSFAAGCVGLCRVLFSGKSGLITPNLHLKALNPHMEFGEQVALCTEHIEHRINSSYSGCTAKGFGGTNVHAIIWSRVGDADEKKRYTDTKKIVFWPGGGGELDAEEMPRKKAGYFIAGTWSRGKPEQMQEEGNNSYGYTMVLGENRWERFQIYLDGSDSRRLHPPVQAARKGSAVLGPVKDASGLSWQIDGRPWAKEDSDEEAEAKQSLDFGKIGDKYRIHLRVAGKYRTVEWEKLEDQAGATPERVPEGTYSIMASWNGWQPEEMFRDDSQVGVHFIEVKIKENGGYFQIMRNEDYAQVIYPERYGSDQTAAILGPDELGGDLCWNLNGFRDETFRIEFHRTSENGLDKKKVSWRKVSS
jgi:polyketide synthase-associated protein